MTINNPNNFDPAWSSLDQSQGHNLPTQQIKQVDTRRDSVVTKKIGTDGLWNS